MAVRPTAVLRALAEGNPTMATALRGLLLVGAVLWQLSLASHPMMLSRLMDDPLRQAAPSGLLFPGGLLWHVVLQHWLQSAMGVVLWLYPQAFRRLAALPVPGLAARPRGS